MSKDFIDLDKFLTENISAFVDEEMAYFDSLENMEGHVSEELNEKIIRKITEGNKSLSRENDNSKKGKITYLSFKKILPLIAAAITFMVFTIGASAMNPIQEFIINTYNKYFAVDVETNYNIKNVEFEYKEPTWLPEGEYEKEIVCKNQSKYVVYYKYRTFTIIYNQNLISNSENKIDNKCNDINIKKFNLNNREYVYIDSYIKNINRIYIYDDIYSYKITAPLNCDTLIKISDNIF